jgi:hypothetical protein
MNTQKAIMFGVFNKIHQACVQWRGYLVADKDVIRFHNKMKSFAYFVNQEIYNAQKGKAPYPLAGGALHSITANVLGLHLAIYSLCRDGWSFAAPILLRALHECAINSLAAINSKEDCEYMGFKYSHWFLKVKLNEHGQSDKGIKRIKDQIDDDLKQLDPKFQTRAKHFMYQEKTLGYFYSPEFRSPKHVLEAYGNADWNYFYDLFSGTAHGGFYGMNIMRDEPDLIHPAPRKDNRSQDISLMMSSRLLLEIFRARAIFEKLEIESVYKKLLAELSSLDSAHKIDLSAAGIYQNS